GMLGEEEQVTGAGGTEVGAGVELFADACLQVGVAWECDAMHPHDGLCEAGAVGTAHRDAAPEVGRAVPATGGAGNAVATSREAVGRRSISTISPLPSVPRRPSGNS